MQYFFLSAEEGYEDGTHHNPPGVSPGRAEFADPRTNTR